MAVIMYKSKETGNNGVVNYIYNNHINLLPKAKEISQTFSFINKLQREFLKSIDVNYVKNKEYLQTQKNWSKFKSFLNNYEKNN